MLKKTISLKEAKEITNNLMMLGRQIKRLNTLRSNEPYNFVTWIELYNITRKRDWIIDSLQR